MKYIKKTILGILIVICCIILIKILKNNYLNQDKKQSQIKNFSNMQTVSLDNFWCSTFQMAWKELARSLDVDNIEFIDDENNELVEKLNNDLFGLNSISNKGYYLYVDDAKPETKSIIAQEMKKRFNKSSAFLDTIDLSKTNGKIIYSYLERNYTFLNKFEEKTDVTFLDKNNNFFEVKGFGFFEESNPEILKNVISAYYAYTNYGICLDTKEDEEIILIMPLDIEKDFQTLWEDYQKDQREFGCDITTKDRILIPYININCFFNYNELCGKYIKNTGHYISNAIQNIKFSLNEYGGKIETENLITSITLSSRPEDTKAFSFNKPFIIFIKEKDKEEPYIAFKVYDESFLVLNQ